MITLHMDATQKKERFGLTINGQPVFLSTTSFRYLMALVYAKLTRKDGWIYRDDIEPGINQARYIYRLFHDIAKQVPGLGDLIENDRCGNYGLAGDWRISLNYDNLIDFPDHDVLLWAAEIKGKAAVNI